MTRVNETQNRVYYPGPKFDEMVLGLAECLASHGLSFGEATPETLRGDATAEREQAADNATRRREAERRHGEYLLARHERCERFVKALGMARLAARRDPSLLSELKSFRLRTARRNGAASPTPTAPETVSAPPESNAA